MFSRRPPPSSCTSFSLLCSLCIVLIGLTYTPPLPILVRHARVAHRATEISAINATINSRSPRVLNENSWGQWINKQNGEEKFKTTGDPLCWISLCLGTRMVSLTLLSQSPLQIINILATSLAILAIPELQRPEPELAAASALPVDAGSAALLWPRCFAIHYTFSYISQLFYLSRMLFDDCLVWVTGY
jgi:hypothetical protein